MHRHLARNSPANRSGDAVKTSWSRRPRGSGGEGAGVPKTYRILKFVLGYFGLVFSSSDRKKYSGSLLRDLGATSPMIMEGVHYLRLSNLKIT